MSAIVLGRLCVRRLADHGPWRTTTMRSRTEDVREAVADEQDRGRCSRPSTSP